MELNDSIGNPVPRSSYIIRATELESYLRCPRQWFILSHNGLNLERVVFSPQMRFGTIWHKGLEYYYNSDEVDSSSRVSRGLLGIAEGVAKSKEDLYKELGDGIYTEEFQNTLQKSEQLLNTLMQLYPSWANSQAHPRDSILNPISSEQRFLVPILTPKGNKSRAYLAARLDALVMDNLEQIWVMEHKTRGASSKVDDPQGTVLDLQMGLQLLAVRRYLKATGVPQPVRGVIYNLTRRQMPGPRVRNPIFGRHQVVRSPESLRILERTLYYTYRNMRRSEQIGLANLRYSPQVWAGGYCTWGCPAYSVCEALTRGDDVDHLLTTEFKPRRRTIWEMLEEEMDQS